MKVWLLHMESYGDVDVYSELYAVEEIPFVKQELEYLNAVEGEYEEERVRFFDDLRAARRRGRGEAGIEERFSLELVEVKS